MELQPLLNLSSLTGYILQAVVIDGITTFAEPFEQA